MRTRALVALCAGIAIGCGASPTDSAHPPASAPVAIIEPPIASAIPSVSATVAPSAAPTATAAADATVEATMFPVAAMSFVPRPHSRASSMELRADGTVLRGGKKIGVLARDVVTDPKCQADVAIYNGRTITGGCLKAVFRIDGDRLVEVAGTSDIEVGDDGRAHFSKGDGVSVVVGQVTPLASKRTAALLVALALFYQFVPKGLLDTGTPLNSR